MGKIADQFSRSMREYTDDWYQRELAPLDPRKRESVLVHGFLMLVILVALIGVWSV